MALDGNYAYITAAGRSIGNIIPDVVVEEAHQDRLVITQHPVEGGGLISDHAYKMNPVVEIRAGFSDSSAGQAGYSRERYDALRQIQDAKQLISVYTGKRAYRNMLPAGIAIVTDEKTENSLIAILALEQLTLVSVQTTSADTATPASDPANQADPASTGSVANMGSVDGIGQGSQSFAGAFNPGNFNPDGGVAGTGSFGFDPLPGSPALAANLDGISPAMSVTLPEISVTAPPETVGGLQGAGPDQYAIFGSGP